MSCSRNFSQIFSRHIGLYIFSCWPDLFFSINVNLASFYSLGNISFTRMLFRTRRHFWAWSSTTSLTNSGVIQSGPLAFHSLTLYFASFSSAIVIKGIPFLSTLQFSHSTVGYVGNSSLAISSRLLSLLVFIHRKGTYKINIFFG